MKHTFLIDKAVWVGSVEVTLDSDDFESAEAMEAAALEAAESMPEGAWPGFDTEELKVSDIWTPNDQSS